MKRTILCIGVALWLFATACSAIADGQYALGYSLPYDVEQFEWSSEGGVDVYFWKNSSENTPSCFLSLSIITEYSLQELMEGLKLQADYDGVSGEAIIAGIKSPTFRFYEGNEWDSRVCEYACVPRRDGSILLIETDWFMEAEEGVGQKLLSLRSSITLEGQETQMVQCSLCSGWFEEGNIFRNHVCTDTSDTCFVVTSASVNLRSGAGMQYEVVSTVAKGASFAYLKESKEDEYGIVWYHITNGEDNLWVSSAYTTLQAHP